MDTVDLAARPFSEVADGVFVADLVEGQRMRLARFHLKPGARLDAHVHDTEQVGVVVDGTLRLSAGGEDRVVGTDESFLVPAGERHAAVNEGDDPVDGVCVFSPPER